MIRRKVTSIILVVLSIFVFAGCASIEYQRVTDGHKIVDKIVIEIDEKKLSTKLSADKLETLKEDIKTDIDNYVFALKQIKYNLIRTNTNSSFDYEEGIIIENTGWIPGENGTCTIICQITYLEEKYLQKLNGSEDNAEENTEENFEEDKSDEIIKNLFISKYMMYRDNVFAGMEEMTGVAGKNYFDYYSSNYGEFGVGDLQLSQIYGTTDRGLKSNADFKHESEGINYHLWEIGTQNEEYKTIKLVYHYRTAVGTTGWYILALALSVALAIFLLLYYIMVVRKNKHIQKVSMEEIVVNKFDED